MSQVTPDVDLVLIECDLGALKALTESYESRYSIELVKAPSVCLTMVKAEDSLERQPFYLGEALTTECEVKVNGTVGHGLCLGEEPERAYCIAVCDALLHGGIPTPDCLQAFLKTHGEELDRREREEFAQILRSQVDFKLMEQS